MPVASIPTRCASGAPRASAATRCSRPSASAPWSPSSRPPPNRWSRTTRWSRRSTASARIADEIRAAGRVALHVVADGDAGMRAAIGGLVGLHGRPEARFLPFGEATLVSAAGLDRTEALRRPEAGARRRGDHQGGPRPEVRGGGPRPPRRRAGRLRARHDAGRLPARRLAIEPGPGTGGARAARLQGADRRRRARQGREGGVLRRTAAGGAARLRRRTRRPVVAAGRAVRARSCPASESPRVYQDLELPLIPILAGLERHGVRVDARVLGAPGGPTRAGAGDAGRRDPPPGRRALQHRLAEAARRDPVREAQAAGAEAHRDDAHAVHRGRGARGAGAHPRPAAADPRMAQPVEAQGHLHRRAADAGQPGRPDACTPCSTRPSPPPGG